jgi:hypothetical protein
MITVVARCGPLSALVVLAAGCSLRLSGTGDDRARPAPTAIGESPSIAGLAPFSLPDAGGDDSAEQATDGSAAVDDSGADPEVGAPPDVAPAGDGAAPPDDPLARGLVLYLPFESDRSLLGDGSPLHQVATPHRLDPMAAVVDGAIGQALRFAGGPDGGYLSVDGWALNRIGDAFSVSCWFESPADSAGAGTILSRRWSTVNGFLYRLDIADGKLQLSINAGNVYHGRVTSKEELPRGRWVHLAATFDGLHALVYVDGKPSGSAGYRMGIPDEQTPLLIGASASSSGASSFLGGLLDEVRLYERALAPGEVEALAAPR